MHSELKSLSVSEQAANTPCLYLHLLLWSYVHACILALVHLLAEQRVKFQLRYI